MIGDIARELLSKMCHLVNREWKVIGALDCRKYKKNVELIGKC